MQHYCSPTIYFPFPVRSPKPISPILSFEVITLFHADIAS